MKPRCEIAVPNPGGWLQWRQCENRSRHVVKVRTQPFQTGVVFDNSLVHVCGSHARVIWLDARIDRTLRVFVRGEGDPPSAGGYEQEVEVVEVIE